jgi:hypothetical protein
MTMVSAATTHRLRWHAGLESKTGAEPDYSVAECVGPPGLLGEHLEKAVADLIDAMALLNTELNGTTPSETIGAAGEIPVEVAYAVAEINRLLRKLAPFAISTDATRGLARAAWLVETAWLAVLAGDIDDLRAHLSEEEAMRST